jgi:hypothetical protein
MVMVYNPLLPEDSDEILGYCINPSIALFPNVPHSIILLCLYMPDDLIIFNL